MGLARLDGAQQHRERGKYREHGLPGIDLLELGHLG